MGRFELIAKHTNDLKSTDPLYYEESVHYDSQSPKYLFFITKGRELRNRMMINPMPGYNSNMGLTKSQLNAWLEKISS